MERLPHLREELFREVSPGYCEVKDSNIKSAVQEHEDVQLFRKQFRDAFRTLEDALHRTLVEEAETVNAVTAESDFTGSDFYPTRKISRWCESATKPTSFSMILGKR